VASTRPIQEIKNPTKDYAQNRSSLALSSLSECNKSNPQLAILCPYHMSSQVPWWRMYISMYLIIWNFYWSTITYTWNICIHSSNDHLINWSTVNRLLNAINVQKCIQSISDKQPVPPNCGWLYQLATMQSSATLP